MSFVIKKKATYIWPVTHKVAVDGGKYEKQTFDIEFKRLSASEIKTMLSDEDNNDQKCCRDIVVGWKGILQEDKTEIPFSESALNELLEEPAVASSIVSAFLESLAGSKTKN